MKEKDLKKESVNENDATQNLEGINQEYTKVVKTYKQARKDVEKDFNEKKKLYRRALARTIVSGLLCPPLLISEIPETKDKRKAYLEAKYYLDLMDNVMKSCGSLVNTMNKLAKDSETEESK